MKKIIAFTMLFWVTSGCKKYLDIVPDNIATIDQAFNLRNTAERYLFTCYHYLPQNSNINQSIAMTSGDEIWVSEYYTTPGREIARGNQNVVDPYLNFWQGTRSGRDLYQAIRDCNIFLENIDRVPDMEEFEKKRWIAEVKFLKAYYHFFLFRMYGPIPLKKENLPINAGVETVKVYRDPVDDCINYIVQLLDEAAADLPPKIISEATELGRVTQPAALAIKAYVLVTAASPLFNGNTDYDKLVDNKGTQLFNPVHDPEKWVRAREACKEAVAAAASAGNQLYYYDQSNRQYEVSDTIRTQMNIRNSVNEKWNQEIIWANTNSMTGDMQNQSTPRGLDPQRRANSSHPGNFSVPLKIADLFYTSNGIPLEEDKTWTNVNRLELRTGTDEYQFYIKKGYTTARLNFDREPRYYADLGFDGGIWYGQGKFVDTDTWYVSAKKGEPASKVTNNSFNVTGIWPKKLVNYVNVIQETSYSRENYPWPEMRLANLYLLYAEALNEADGPSAQVYQLLDDIRSRAGLNGVVESWAAYSNNPSKPGTKEGLREIIHRERTIELMFECQRYWDLRRWKKAFQEFNQPITGWDIEQQTAESYYRTRVLYQQRYLTKNYLWPIRETEILANKNTVQNPGW
ncbi:RagB/SusD family nutrient uptake outer membrane protein [Niabella terrae]